MTSEQKDKSKETSIVKKFHREVILETNAKDYDDNDK